MNVLQAIRDALAELAPDGYNPYPTLPNDAHLPALVVGLPELVTPLTPTVLTAVVPVWIVVGPDLEQELLAAALEVSGHYAGATSSAWTSCRVENIDEFGSIDNGPTRALGCVVNLELTARHQQTTS